MVSYYRDFLSQGIQDTVWLVYIILFCCYDWRLLSIGVL